MNAIYGFLLIGFVVTLITFMLTFTAVFNDVRKQERDRTNVSILVREDAFRIAFLQHLESFKLQENYNISPISIFQDVYDQTIHTLQDPSKIRKLHFAKDIIQHPQINSEDLIKSQYNESFQVIIFDEVDKNKDVWLQFHAQDDRVST